MKTEKIKSQIASERTGAAKAIWSHVQDWMANGTSLDEIEDIIDPHLSAAAQRGERAVEALRKIHALNLGPNKGSSGWQSEQAHQIAGEFLSTTPQPESTSMETRLAEALENVCSLISEAGAP